MKQLSKNNSTLLFTLLTAVLIVVAFISYQKMKQFNKSVEAVTHTNLVKNKVVEVALNLKDANIGQRGFLLTNDSTFLRPFNEAESHRSLLFASLDSIITDNPIQQENLKQLKLLVDERYVLLNKSLKLAKNTTQDSAINAALIIGKMKMDELKQQIALMLQTEDAFLQKRIDVKDRSSAFRPVFLLLLSLFSILVITLFFFRLQKETNELISITEKNKLLQQLNEQLEASEKRFRMLTETIPHMIWTACPDGNKNFFNQFFLDYTGLSIEELKGDGIFQIIHPDDREKDIQLWQHSLKTGKDFIIEKRFLHHTGIYKWHLSRAIAQRDSDGNITEWIGTSTEIEDQKKITEALRSGEEQFRTFANSIQNLAWIADGDGSVYWFNQKWFDYTGTTLEEMTGWGWLKVHHPDYIKKVDAFFKEAWKKDEAIEITFPLRKYDGEYRWFLTRAYPHKDVNGNVERWIGTNTDITEQKVFTEELEARVNERTKELQIQNHTFELAENISKFGSYRMNSEDGTLEYSDNLFRLLDCEPQEFVPTMDTFLSFIHPDDLQQVISNGEQTAQTGELVETPYRIISKKGVVKYFRSSGRFVGDSENRMLIGTVQDISEDVKASKTLKNKNIELENTNTELASFSYVASHDLQEPLRKIQGFSKRIIDQDGENLSSTTKDYFDRINAAAKRMQNLIESLLSYSRTNVVEVKFEKTDLNQILIEVQSTLQEIIAQKNVIIETQQLPTLNALPIQMQQLFLNLINNAIKYSKPNVAPHIKITAEKVNINETIEGVKQNGVFWKIVFSDNGIGFEQQYEPKIFEVFQRLHGKTEYEGTGIGLAICKKIVQAHNGSISATGQVGIGATFTFLLSDNIKL